MRSYLSIALLYDLFQRAVGRDKCARMIVDQFVPKRANLRILDLGCGTGELISWG